MCISYFLHDFKSINLNAFLHISVMTPTLISKNAFKECVLFLIFYMILINQFECIFTYQQSNNVSVMTPMLMALHIYEFFSPAQAPTQAQAQAQGLNWNCSNYCFKSLKTLYYKAI